MQIKLYEYDFATLKEQGIRYIMFDVDNTLLKDHSKEVDQDAVDLVKKLKNLGFHLFLVSNGKVPRISKIAEALKLNYLAMAQKPLTHKVEAFIKEQKVDKQALVFVGDQWFTDMMCAQKLGVKALWVEPRDKNERFWIAMKRPFEKIYVKLLNYRRKV